MPNAWQSLSQSFGLPSPSVSVSEPKLISAKASAVSSTPSPSSSVSALLPTPSPSVSAFSSALNGKRSSALFTPSPSTSLSSSKQETLVTDFPVSCLNLSIWLHNRGVSSAETTATFDWASGDKLINGLSPRSSCPFS